MQWLFILIAAGWVILSVVNNKKRQQRAREEAEKRAAVQEQAPRPAPQPVRESKPFSPFFPDVENEPARPMQQAARPMQPPPTARPQQPMQPPPEARSQEPMRQAMRAAPATRMQVGPTSSLTEIQQTQRHTLSPSGETGHAHQETSMTGFAPDCPPETAPASRREPAEAAAYAGMPAFSWNPSAVLNGMVYAEILAKPKALRG